MKDHSFTDLNQFNLLSELPEDALLTSFHLEKLFSASYTVNKENFYICKSMKPSDKSRL